MPQQYKIYFHLYGINDVYENLKTLLYAPSLHWHQEQLKNTTHKDYYLEALKQTLEQVKKFQETTTLNLVEHNSTIELSFVLDHKENLGFEEQNEQGLRPWLRNYIHDMFYYGTLVHLTSAFLQDDALDMVKQTEYNRIFHAFKNALSKKNQMPEPTFWIENECDAFVAPMEMTP